jgi:hypothetical protein
MPSGLLSGAVQDFKLRTVSKIAENFDLKIDSRPAAGGRPASVEFGGVALQEIG